jgi:SWI/SNF-related matrix-associated actin-dependent regulator of chromatin subfamily A3
MAVSGASKIASTTLQSIHELRLFCNNGPRKIQNGQHGSDDEILSYLQQLEQNICAKCSIPIYYIDQVGEKNGGIFIPPCKHLVCHSCQPQCLKKKVCMLCESGHVPPDLTNHIGTEASNLVAEEAPVEYPSKLLALLRDIKMEPSHKW